MNKRFILLIVFSMIIALLNSSVVKAIEAGTTISVKVTSQEVLRRESTIYVGEILVNGVSQMQYIYSSDTSRTEVLTNHLQNIIPNKFKQVIPEYVGEQEEKGFKEYNYTIEPETSIDQEADWTSATSVANALYPSLGTIGEEVNQNIYDYSEQAAQAIDASRQERIDTYDTVVPSLKELVMSLNTTTDFVWVNKDGVLEKEYTVTSSVEKITINYSSVNIISDKPLLLKGDLDKNGVVDANDASVVLELYKAQNATAEDIAIGDMDNNNLIDANDASLILEYYKTHQ